ncbi:hypothetical protein [Prosthecomicrobium sp. N25]|uniref:hypothetical protein n=1 Tax=Prosthecomicrobium sp. N25 TaxID=3129254 RepID=UPI0030779256
MKRLVVHIGNPKTGSTSLQNWLAQHRDRLAEAGFAVPVINPRMDATGHRGLALALEGAADRDAAENLVGRLEATLASTPCDTVLVTAERLQGADPRARVPDRIAGIAARHGFRPLVIAFVRPQPAYLNSFYAHDVRRLFTPLRFRPWVERAMTDRRYDYDRHYRQWTDRPDMDFVPVPFTGAELAVGLERRFLMAAGLSDRLEMLADLPSATSANEAPGPLTVEVYRRIAARSGRSRIGEAYPDARRVIQAETDRLGWNRSRFSGLDPDLAARIEARFEAGNRAFAERHWGRSWSEVFARDRIRPPSRNEVDPETLDPRYGAEIEDLAESILERFGRPERMVERLRRALRRGG